MGVMKRFIERKLDKLSKTQRFEWCGQVHIFSNNKSVSISNGSDERMANHLT